MFVHLESPNGDVFAVNASQVCFVEPSGAGATLYFGGIAPDDATLCRQTTTPYDVVVEALAAANFSKGVVKPPRPGKSTR